MRGRKPTPTALKLIAGNPGKRKLRTDEFRPYGEVPRAPRHLRGEALKEWRRITSELDRYGMVSEVDRGALAMLCTCWARYVHAEEMIEAEAKRDPTHYGLFAETPKNKFPIQAPWLAVSNKAMEQYKVFCAEFGMTPSARSRLPTSTTQMPLFDVNAGEKATGTDGPAMPPASFDTFR